MKKLIKKTIKTILGKEDYIIMIMDEINFKEESRTIISHSNNIYIILNFIGENSDFDISHILEISNYDNTKIYYSLLQPEGYHLPIVHKEAIDFKKLQTYNIIKLK